MAVGATPGLCFLRSDISGSCGKLLLVQANRSENNNIKINVKDGCLNIAVPGECFRVG